MRNASIVGKKLLNGITGKELVGLLLQHTVERGADTQPTFTEEELFAATSKLTDKQKIEFNAYMDIILIVQAIAYEARIAGLHLIWRLSLCSTTADYFRDLGAAKHTEIHQTICFFLQRFYTLQTGLRIIGKYMGTDLMALIEYESRNIATFLECYHSVQSGLADIISPQPDPDLAVEVEACLHKPKGKEIWKLVSVLRADAYSFPLK